ncbi:hypothetical protein HYW59_00060 [Candidatus Kaiserbacteria bacterium]|nr:hypothetical protein [Candidatus Kaiserbacteria bacterium]
MELTYQQSLVQSGLEKNQALIYEALVKNGSLPASSAARLAGLGRPLTYNVLDELIAIGLVEEKKESGKVARFYPAHPLKLKEIIEKRLEAAQGARTALEGVLGKLTSDFNLVSGKPGVRFFEGLDGVKAVLDDSLTAKETILSYADVLAVEKYIAELNREYVRSRERLDVKKNLICADTEMNRTFFRDFKPTLTQIKLVDMPPAPFKTIMQIYDGKISYFTLGAETLIGIIVADSNLYMMHKMLFEKLWESPLAHAAARSETSARAPRA